jgi:hypothetical protein
MDTGMDFTVSAPIPKVNGDVELKVTNMPSPTDLSHDITAQVMTQQVNTTA